MAQVKYEETAAILNKLFAKRMVEQANKSAVLANLLGPPPVPAPPPTRWARFRTWLEGLRQDVGFWIAGRDPRDEDHDRDAW